MKTTAALLFVTLVAATAAAQPAPATPPATPGSALAAEAAKLYAAGDYLGAADRFDKAYALDQTLSYLYNAAQAYRLGKSCAISAARYERFLDIAPKDAQNLDKVRQYLEDEHACAKDQALAQPPAPVPVPQPVAPPVVTPQPKPLPQPARLENHDHTWMRPTGLGVGIAGVVLLAFGGYEASVVHDKNSAHSLCDTVLGSCTAQQAIDIDAEGKSASTRMGLSIGVGAAALVGGGILYYLGRDPEGVAVAPTAGGAVMSFGGRF